MQNIYAMITAPEGKCYHSQIAAEAKRVQLACLVGTPWKFIAERTHTRDAWIHSSYNSILFCTTSASSLSLHYITSPVQSVQIRDFPVHCLQTSRLSFVMSQCVDDVPSSSPGPLGVWLVSFRMVLDTAFHLSLIGLKSHWPPWATPTWTL